MKAGTIKLLTDFFSNNKVLFRIPVYQRNYDWAEANCKRLLEDTKNIIDTEHKHFLGAIVFLESKESGFSTVREYTIIDGQQRITTIMILLKALADVANENGDVSSSDDILETYIRNQRCDEEYKIKLKPVKGDNAQFLLLLENKFDEMDKSCHIYLNYDTCKKTIANWLKSNIKINEILKALLKLEVVEIVLIKDEDDPQIIFESINSTGLDLSNADLIRNFLLMNTENQEYLYEKYWMEIEKSLKNGNDYTNLNLFFIQYLSFKTNTIFNSNRLYENFVTYFKANIYTQEGILIELKEYANIFKAFVYDDDSYSDIVRKMLKNIRLLKQTTCYPFLMHIFYDYNQKIIDLDTLGKLVTLIFVYLLRRAVCGVPSNSLRAMFTYLYNRVFKIAKNKEKYYRSVNKYFFTMTSRDVIPSENEFKKALQKYSLYRNKPLCSFLLADIENGNQKEVLKMDKMTIEHIMPQSLSYDWLSFVSETEHEELLDTIGNLSITGYNSELSNKSFEDKKKIIIENSKAIILNSDVINKDVWNAKTITERALRLSKIIINHYSVKEEKDSSIDFEYNEKFGFEDINSVTGKRIVAFEFEGVKYSQNKFIGMLSDMIKLLNNKQPSLLEQLTMDNTKIMNQKSIILSFDSNSLRHPLEVVNGIFLECNFSAAAIMKITEGFVVAYGADSSSFFVYVAMEKENQQIEDVFED